MKPSMEKVRFGFGAGFCSLVFGMVFSACSFSAILADPSPTPTQTATSTATSTPTPAPSSTPTPAPTHTPQPSLTPTVEMPLMEKDEQVFHGGEFAFKPLWGYYMDYDDYSFVITNEDQLFTIVFTDLFPSETELFEENLNEYMLAGVMERMNAEYQILSDTAVQIDGLDGTVIDFSGTVTGKSFAGKTVLINRGEGRVLYGMGMGFSFTGVDHWAADGQRVFGSILSTLRFVTTEPGACRVSTDPEYGYTEAKAIRVGGGAWDGPPRERYYLDNLKGPHGEEVTYQRLGSLPYEDTILDEYEVVYGDTTVLLYIDEYAFEPPLAPLGFTCWGEFPLNQP